MPMTISDVARPVSAGVAGERDEAEFHGGDVDAVSRKYPDAPQPWIDLSTGINPVAYPIPPLAPDVWSRLPMREEDVCLRRAAAHRYGVSDPDRIAAAPGTQALIQIIPRLLPPSDVAIVSPTYREHLRCWRRLGHNVRVVGDLSEIGNAKVAVIVNPNNPTGRHYEPRLLLGLAEDMVRRQGLVIVDEAFVDLLGTDQSVVPLTPPSTIVLRSFGKTYGLAGVRLGFAIAEPEIASLLRSWIGPWAVSGPAISVGCRALDDDEWLKNTRDRLVRVAQRLDKLLLAADFEILGTTPLFRLAEHAQAENAAQSLARAGIHVRQFSDQRTWLRFGIPAEASLQRLEGALSAFSLRVSGCR